jgi:hypothetical protein
MHALLLKFQSDVTVLCSSLYGARNGAWDELRSRVEADMQNLSERVVWEIERRARLGRDDEAMRLLPPVRHYLNLKAWT